ncbi:MAG: putative nuclease YhcG [Elusimicrobia bacterium]|nr:putative nuclease YhcG [Elusimicrobiota bacterium]
MTGKLFVKKESSRARRVEKLFNRISLILEHARRNVVRTVNTEMVQAYWMIGQEIVEEEQQGRARAEYGEGLIENLSHRLSGRYGRGFTPTLLKRMRQFYLRYKKGAATRLQLGKKSNSAALRHYSSETWSLSWTHYRTLITVESQYARAFYETEAMENNWSARELERQINSLLFERLAKSRDKKGLLKLAQKGQEIQTPEDAIKDPFVLEFLDLPESHKLVESNLEQALITDLQNFLLELGKGFAFIERQSRLTLDGDHCG